MLPLNKIIVNTLRKAYQNILNNYTLTLMDYKFKIMVKNLIQYKKIHIPDRKVLRQDTRKLDEFQMEVLNMVCKGCCKSKKGWKHSP